METTTFRMQIPRSSYSTKTVHSSNNAVVEKIDVEELIKDFKIVNVNNFSAYLKELWKDLTDRSDNRKLGVNKMTFSNYFTLPGLLFDRLYAVFDKNQNDYLDLLEFLDGMMTLYSENYEKLTKFIFRYYDFDKDGYISKEDIRIVLSYIPLNMTKSSSILRQYKLKLEKEEFKDRIESQDELQVLLELCFKNIEFIDEKAFLNIIENTSSDIFLYILIFLMEQRPFSKKTLDEYEGQRKYNTLLKVIKTPNPELKRFMITSPNLNSKFSPSVTIKKTPFWNTRNLMLNPPTFHNIQISCQTQSNPQNNLITNNLLSTNKQCVDLLNKLGRLNISPYNPNSNNSILKINNAVDESKKVLLKSSNIKTEQIIKPLDDVNMVTDHTESSTNPTREMLDSYKSNNNTTETLSSIRVTENDLMLVDENVSIKNIPIFRKHWNFLKKIESKKLNSNNLVNLKNYDNLEILPAAKYIPSVHVNNISIKRSLIKEDKVSYSTGVKFTFNAIQDDSDEEDEEVHFEGFLYKISRGKKLKKRYFKLIHKDLYHYRNKSDLYHKGLHNISGVFIQEGQPLQFNEYYFYSFSMIYNNKTRIYYTDNEDDFHQWIKWIKKATGYSDLKDMFDVKEKLGNGKFGLVRLGMHRETGRKVAIKIIYKGDMTIPDMELVKTEIEILKVCQHPSIIRIYDVYENADYIYIVMEYCSGGDLFSYLEKRNFRLPERTVASIIHKLATAVYYLYSYGIAHRDLKPENILMTTDSDDSGIRLVDFGLSKIIGPNETCSEPFGTLSYVAPEVLLELPYNKSVDMWGLGVITYLLLTGCLPFDDENSDFEVARKTIHEPVPFPNFFWKNISPEAKDFIIHLLQKDPSRRISVKHVLEHSWIQKYSKKVLPEIKKKNKDNMYSTFRIYSTTEDYSK